MTSAVLARRFHEAYERLAPNFGYETRHETREFNPDSPNGRLMIAVCEELFGDALAPDTPSLTPDPATVTTKAGRRSHRHSWDFDIQPLNGAISTLSWLTCNILAQVCNCGARREWSNGKWKRLRD